MWSFLEYVTQINGWGGGGREDISDPILSFWSKLGPRRVPLYPCHPRNLGGGSEFNFRLFGATFFFLYGLDCGSYGRSHHVKGQRDPRSGKASSLVPCHLSAPKALRLV